MEIKQYFEPINDNPLENCPRLVLKSGYLLSKEQIINLLGDAFDAGQDMTYLPSHTAESRKSDYLKKYTL